MVIDPYEFMVTQYYFTVNYNIEIIIIIIIYVVEYNGKWCYSDAITENEV